MTLSPTAIPEERPDRSAFSANGIYAIAVSQFGIAFSFNCIMSFMPFYILQISPYEAKATMVWIGLIMGSASLVAAFAAPFWGSLTARVRPKLLFQCGIFFNAVIFFIMGFITNLPVLLLLRFAQGVLGGASTIGLVLIAGSSPRDTLAKHLSLFQNAITFGQLIGPPLGAYAVGLLGYRSPFVIALVVLLSSMAFCHKHVLDISARPKLNPRETALAKGLPWGLGLIVVGTVQLMFLPSVLPHILQGFQLEGQAAIAAAGTIVMIYTATAIIGNHLLVNLVPRAGTTRIIALACLSAAALQGLLYFSTGLYSFTIIRLLQTGMIAAVIPLVTSTFAGEGRGGTTLGILNSGRFVGNALGPIMATFVVSRFGLLSLYLTIAGLTVILLLTFLAARGERTTCP